LRTPGGYQVVLTADATLMADYRLLFDGMLAASQTTRTPSPLMRVLAPRPPRGAVRAAVAPMGLRRIEAALLADGFSPDEVVVVHPTDLRRAIGPATRVVGVSSGEPLGMGMNTTTMAGIVGGRIYPARLFRKLMRSVRRLMVERAPSARVLLGGPGAWQVAGSDCARRELGIDCVVAGYAEGNAAEVFRTAAAGGELPELLAGVGVAADRIPPIAGAATMGAVELSRGCGLGCSFCTIASVPMIHLPERTIIADAQTNVAAGRDSIAALSEDFFRYGADGLAVNPNALIALLERLREIDGLRLIQIDHANVVSVAGFDDAELARVRELLVGPNRHRYMWVNIGVETASGRLLRANGRAKMAECPVDDWAELCAEQVKRLCRAGFFPMISLMIGLPGERPGHVRETLMWVRSLSRERIAVFPMLYAPVDGSEPPDMAKLAPLHWRLIRECYALNFRWVPRMYWDNQAGAGVGLARRCLMQALGRAQMLQWHALFLRHSLASRLRHHEP